MSADQPVIIDVVSQQMLDNQKCYVCNVPCSLGQENAVDLFSLLNVILKKYIFFVYVNNLVIGK